MLSRDKRVVRRAEKKPRKIMVQAIRPARKGKTSQSVRTVEEAASRKLKNTRETAVQATRPVREREVPQKDQERARFVEDHGTGKKPEGGEDL